MICHRCRKWLDAIHSKCPFCGSSLENNRSGFFRTASVFVSTDGTEGVYGSVDELPAALQTQLQKTTNGPNSATILIADRHGRREIARAMRSLQGSAGRLSSDQRVDGDQKSGQSTRFLPCRKNLVLALLVFLALAFIIFVFSYSR